MQFGIRRRVWLRILGLLVGVLVAMTGASVKAQSATAGEGLYFPPNNDHWERVEPASVGWDKAKLDAALDVAQARHSSGVMVLYRGRVMAERYWDLGERSARYRNMLQGVDGEGRTIEDVASVQKSVVTALTGIAQHRGLLALDDPVSRHLGRGWSKASTEQESGITIRHLLTMTSGLTSDLEFAADAGSAWLYNTPAYHHVLRVLTTVAGKDRNALTREWLTDRIGMVDSAWVPRPWAPGAVAVGFATSARDLARFGLLILAEGYWNHELVLGDQAFLTAALQPSQTLNPAYGYLWWLNGKDFWLAFADPPERVDRALIPSAPSDLVAMQGALDRKVYVVPSLGLVVVRLGDRGSTDEASFSDIFWTALSQAVPH